VGVIVIPAGAGQLEQMAELLTLGFVEWQSWQDPAEARAEVDAVRAAGFVRAFVDGERVLGWVGGLPEYHGRVWELHPLVVRAEAQGRGVGRALVAAFETEARARGGLTATLGTDDVDDRTSLGGVDLYDDLPARLADVKNLGRHPFGFYLRCGYAITGVVPDANGRGKPDIYMSKRLGPGAP
jgi:aminoglycoside 6'-N-acetyltransferase I